MSTTYHPQRWRFHCNLLSLSGCSWGNFFAAKQQTLIGDYCRRPWVLTQLNRQRTKINDVCLNICGLFRVNNLGYAVAKSQAKVKTSSWNSASAVSFSFGFSRSCPCRHASQYADFRFQFFLFFALFQEVGYYKKISIHYKSTKK